jgi:hypothetical protein
MNSDLLALSTSDNGKFKVVNLSDFIPQAAVLEPINAFFNTKDKLNDRPTDTTDKALTYFFGDGGPVMTFFESYLSTPIGFEPFADILLRKGRTDTGKQIYSTTDNPGDKFEKMFYHVAKTLEPGIITTSRKFKDAIIKQPTSSGTLRTLQDQSIGASTGLKPFDANILTSMDYIISDYSRIRSNVFKAEKFYKFDKMYTRGGEVLKQEYIQREAWIEQRKIQDAIEAAIKLNVDFDDIEDLMKERAGLGKKQIRKILDGEFIPVPYSDNLFKKKLKTIERNEKDSGMNKKRNIEEDFHYPKDMFEDVLDDLKGTMMDKNFFYDRKKDDNTSELITNEQPVKVAQTSKPKIETQPLPPQPAVRVASNVNASPPFASLPKNDQFKLLFPNG